MRKLSLAPFMSWIPLVAPIRTGSRSTFIRKSMPLPRIPIQLPLRYPKQSVCLWLAALTRTRHKWQPINVFGIFGDEYGYVTLSFGSFRTHNNDFIVVGPNGSVAESGAVSQFMLNTVQAV